MRHIIADPFTAQFVQSTSFFLSCPLCPPLPLPLNMLALLPGDSAGIMYSCLVGGDPDLNMVHKGSHTSIQTHATTGTNPVMQENKHTYKHLSLYKFTLQ